MIYHFARKKIDEKGCCKKGFIPKLRGIDAFASNARPTQLCDGVCVQQTHSIDEHADMTHDE
jgi:hypothetical protein